MLINGKKYEKYQIVQDKLEDKYDSLCTAFEHCKEEILEKGQRVGEFNALEGDEPVYRYNDAWKQERDKEFENLFNVLNDDSPKPDESEEKLDVDQTVQISLICQEINSILEVTRNSTAKLAESINKLQNNMVEESTITGFVDMINLQRVSIKSDLNLKLKERLQLSDVGAVPENTNAVLKEY